MGIGHGCCPSTYNGFAAPHIGTCDGFIAMTMLVFGKPKNANIVIIVVFSAAFRFILAFC